jgi:hypothetical protein
MGKYMGSPWGYIRGKVADVVGIAWKGIDSNRVRVLPAQRGTMKMFKAVLAGSGSKRFSYAQWNVRNAALGVMGNVARENMTNWIDPVWQVLATKRKVAMTGINLFIKEALPLFFASMPQKTQLYVEATNAPLLTSLKVSDGDLEGIPSITTATYATGTGVVHATWPVTFTRNGLATDKVYALVARKPLLNTAYGSALTLYGNCVAVPTAVRSAGTAGADVITIPLGLTPADLFLYLFTKDAVGTIGFSESVCKVTAAP